jgi:DNA-binding NarL/FixJ family response regulator
MINDNSRNFRRSLADILAARFSVRIREGEAVCDQDRFVKTVDAFAPDLIFLDMHSFGPTCGELTRRVKAAHPEVKVILLTSFDQIEYRQFAHACGADGCLLKNNCTPEEIAGIAEPGVDAASVPVS